MAKDNDFACSVVLSGLPTQRPLGRPVQIDSRILGFRVTSCLFEFHLFPENLSLLRHALFCVALTKGTRIKIKIFSKPHYLTYMDDCAKNGVPGAVSTLCSFNHNHLQH